MSAQQIEHFGLLARLFTAPAPDGRVARALEAREAMQRHRQGRPLAFPARPLVTDEQATGLRLYPECGRTVHAEGIPTNAGHQSGRTAARNRSGGNPDGQQQ